MTKKKTVTMKLVTAFITSIIMNYHLLTLSSATVLQVLLHELLIEHAAHFPCFDFLINFINAKPAYPNIIPPIMKFTIITFIP